MSLYPPYLLVTLYGPPIFMVPNNSPYVTQPSLGLGPHIYLQAFRAALEVEILSFTTYVTMYALYLSLRPHSFGYCHFTCLCLFSSGTERLWHSPATYEDHHGNWTPPPTSAHWPLINFPPIRGCPPVKPLVH